jgi:hypothetical protein
MVFPYSLRTRYGVLFGTSLAACSAIIGCNVYGDELLRRPDDPSDTLGDARAPDDATTNGGATTDARTDNVRDATLTDVASDGGKGTTTDGSAPDGAPVDAGAPRSDADAATQDGASDDASSKSDALDARIDSTTGTGSGDVDAGSRAPDANDATSEDAPGSTDAGARDGGSGTTDVAGDGGVGPPTFRVVRVGDGATQLSAASAAVFIEERGWNGQVVGQPLALPTSRSGDRRPLTLSGIATSEGALSLSLDGRYLTLAGYAAGPDRSNIAATTDVDRVVARVDAASSIDTTTLLGDAFSGSNARSAASIDGTAFWVAGASGGVWFAPIGGSGLEQIVATPDNVRLVALFGDQLFGCSAASPMTGVFAIGTGRPTSGRQNVIALAGLPQSGTSPYAFALLDRDLSVNGLDTLYLTDDRSPENDGNGGGIQKWTLRAGTWSRAATFTAVGGETASFRGLAAAITQVGVLLVASTAETSGNRLVAFLDDGSPNPTGIVVATAPNNTMFRGVALSPHF